MNKDEMGRSFMGGDATLDAGGDLYRFRGNMQLVISTIIPLETDASFNDDNDLPRGGALEFQCVAVFGMYGFHLRCRRWRCENRNPGHKTSLKKTMMNTKYYYSILFRLVPCRPAVHAA